MPATGPHLPVPLLLAVALASPAPVHAADTGASAEDEVIIEIDAPADAGAAGEIVIDGDAPGDEVLVIEPEETGTAASAAPAAAPGPLSLRIDDARAEYAHFTDGASAADNALYGKLSARVNWQADPAWELQLSGRIDGYDEDGDRGFSAVRADYGDSFVRYRGDNLRLTFGAQTVIWGRIDELPLADRVSTADLTRGPLDELQDRRRANPMLRAETFVGGGSLDLVWLLDFRPAELPDQDSVWYPVDTHRGRILGIDPDDLPPAAVRGAVISDDAPDGDGGFGARYTRTHSFADIGVTVANTRQSIPYFRATAPARFEAEYPRSWAYGADAAVDAAGATWRVELLYSSDNPVTREDLTYTTTAAMQWAAGAEFHPGDGDTRVNLQLVGMNLVDAPSILDRSEIYSLNGEVETPFDRARWRAKVRFYYGLDERDIYLAPELAFLGWEPHEFYLALHYFDGGDQSIGGFYEDNASVNLGWRAKF